MDKSSNNIEDDDDGFQETPEENNFSNGEEIDLDRDEVDVEDLLGDGNKLITIQDNEEQKLSNQQNTSKVKFLSRGNTTNGDDFGGFENNMDQRSSEFKLDEDSVGYDEVDNITSPKRQTVLEKSQSFNKQNQGGKTTTSIKEMSDWDLESHN